MKKSEMREVKLEELKQKETEFEDQLFKLRFQLATGQIENPGRIRSVRKDIARIKTFIREKSKTESTGKAAAPKKSDYFIKERGWLDLLGSIPSVGLTKYASLLRLARLSRLARIWRLLREEGGRELINDVIRNRSHYTAYLTMLLVIIVTVSLVDLLSALVRKVYI